MPLKSILTGKAARCTAKAKHSGTRCWRLASYDMPTCYVHGARKAHTIRRGASHPQYRHGGETLEAKAERSRVLAELRDLEALSFTLGLVSEATSRWRGRKPARR